MTEYHILKRIHSVFTDCKLCDFPIDIPTLLQHYGYTLYSYEELRKQSEELYRLCVSCSDDAFQYTPKKLIAYNSQMPPARIAFTLAHELGHYILGHDKQITASGKPRSSSAQKRLEKELEWEANFFASHLLAPRPAIHFSGCKNAADVSRYFHLSLQAGKIAWEDYLKWERRLTSPMQKLSPAEESLFIYFYTIRHSRFHTL